MRIRGLVCDIARTLYYLVTKQFYNVFVVVLEMMNAQLINTRQRDQGTVSLSTETAQFQMDKYSQVMTAV